MVTVGLASSVPRGKIHISGNNNSVSLGPHIEFTTSSDTFPLLQILPLLHDNVSLAFDLFHDGTNYKSSDSGSNFLMIKSGDTFKIQYDSGITAGNAVTLNTGIELDTSGVVDIPGSLKIDTINESAADAGVTLDGNFLFKDDIMNLNGTDARITLDRATTGDLVQIEFQTNAVQKARIQMDSGENIDIVNPAGTGFSMLVDLGITLSNRVFTDTANDRALFIESAGPIGTTSSLLIHKMDITNMDDPSSWFYNLSPKRYHRKKRDPNDKAKFINQARPYWECGFIAEEVEIIHPDICDYDYDQENPLDKGGPKINILHGLRDRCWSSILVKICQQQKVLIDSLTTRITALETYH